MDIAFHTTPTPFRSHNCPPRLEDSPVLSHDIGYRSKSDDLQEGLGVLIEPILRKRRGGHHRALANWSGAFHAFAWRGLRCAWMEPSRWIGAETDHSISNSDRRCNDRTQLACLLAISPRNVARELDAIRRFR